MVPRGGLGYRAHIHHVLRHRDVAVWRCVGVCVCEDDLSAVPGAVSRCPMPIQSYAQSTLPQHAARVQQTAAAAARYGGHLPSLPPPGHPAAAPPPTYHHAVTSFRAPDCDVVAAPGSRCCAGTGSRLTRSAAEAAARHTVAVRLLERANGAGGGDPARR